MSYDVDMCVDTGRDYPAEVHGCGNYTYNVSGMYHAVLRGPSTHEHGRSHGLYSLHGVTGAEALPHLDDAIRDFEARREEMESMNPGNGWGNAEGALRFLRSIREGCERHPKAMVWVS